MKSLKNHDIMKNPRFIFLTLMLLATFAAMARRPQCDEQVFGGRFHDVAAASETIVTGSALEPYTLTIYKGLTITDAPAYGSMLEEFVEADLAAAIDRETVYRSGHLYYAFLSLPQSSKLNRYVLYLNQTLAGGNRIILIYMEGQADADLIKKMLKKN